MKLRIKFTIGNEKISNKFNISSFIYSQQRFRLLQSLSSSLIKCLQFQVFFMQILKNNKTKDTYLLSNKSNSTEVVFLFKLGVSLLIRKLPLVSKETVEEYFARTENSSREGSLSQNSRWSRTILSFEGLHFLKVKGDEPICSPALTFRCLFVSP